MSLAISRTAQSPPMRRIAVRGICGHYPSPTHVSDLRGGSRSSRDFPPTTSHAPRSPTLVSRSHALIVVDAVSSLAGAEHDIDALDLAIEMYEHLLTTAQSDAQRSALEGALGALRGWKL